MGLDRAPAGRRLYVLVALTVCWVPLAAQGVEAEEKAVLLAAQVEEQAQQLPELEEALRQALDKLPSE